MGGGQGLGARGGERVDRAPNTGTCPVFRTRRDAEITLGIYKRVPVLIKEGDPDGNPWGIKFMTMFHMSNDSHLFHTREELDDDGWVLNGNVFERAGDKMLPLYQGIMAEPYDHRVADVVRSSTAQIRQNQPSYLSDNEKADPGRMPTPAYWVSLPECQGRLGPYLSRDVLLGFRDITSPTNERTVLPVLIPVAAVNNKIPLILPESGSLHLHAALASYVLDYTARQKLGGTTLNYFYVRQFPVPGPESLAEPAPWGFRESVRDWIQTKALELHYSSWDMEPLAKHVGYGGAPFLWNPERRLGLRAELDAAFFHLYGLTRDEVDYVMDTFPIVQRKDLAEFGEYRTKRLVLQIYDAMQQAIDTGVPYASATELGASR